MARVLVTRPEPGAGATARRLAALGHEPLVLPLSELRALPAVLPPARGIDAVAFTSASALRFLDRAAFAPFLDRPCFAVGERTARAARAAGFALVRTGEGDGMALAALVAAGAAAGWRVLYPCGRPRRPEFERELAGQGLSCVAVETYEAVFPVIGPEAVERVASGGTVDFVLLHSPEGARAFVRLRAAPGASGHFAGSRYLCLSRRIAEAATGLPADRVSWSGTPDEAALLALLPPAPAGAATSRP